MMESKTNILVVDDDEATRYTLVHVLNRAGFATWEAKTGEEALRLAENGPHLVLLDIQLPDMLGYDVCRQLKGNPNTTGIPVLHVSATFHRSCDKVQGLEGGADAYLTWPVEPEELLANVRVLLRLREANDSLRKAQAELQQHTTNLEKTVAERTAQLQESIRELEGFTYSITHDMRAPLRTMQGFAKMLLDDYAAKLDEDGQEHLKRIINASKRLDLMIQDVLNYSKIVRREIRIEPMNLDKLVRDIIRDYRQFQSPHAEVTIQGQLPRVMGNEALLTQCFSNLFDNAVKFVSAVTSPRVQIWADRKGEFVRIWVADNGIGMDPRHQDKIFKMFERLHPSREYAGTGVGLAIVRKAVERLGGEVGVESELGKGSRFWLELRVAADE